MRTDVNGAESQSSGSSDLLKLDQKTHALLGHVTGGLSPIALTSAYLDWLAHLFSSPTKLAELRERGFHNIAAFGSFASCATLHSNTANDCLPPTTDDRRFAAPEWDTFPYNTLSQSFLLAQDWWQAATRNIYGLDPKHEQVAAFMARQCLDMMSPSNSPFTNPVVVNRTLEEKGKNFVRGWRYFWEDYAHLIDGVPRKTGDYAVGKNLATTPGKVVFKNELFELLAYEAQTETVHPEPILIVPAWIMKYYILDLSEHNSLIRYLTAQGFTVFAMSWKNPGKEDRDVSLEDYRRQGFETALDVVSKIIPDSPVHATGYCLGGTLLGIGAAGLSKRQDMRLGSLTFFASQFDFEDAGELTLFINESQIAFLEDIMADQGYLHADQMAGAFQMLRSNDLIWSRVIRHYLLGERTGMNDLMAWNADSTRMPAKMHSEYLRSLFLNNDLAENRYKVDGSVISIADIRQPIFAVGTETDHVCPWKSAFKVNALTDTDVTFLLTNGGHNAGIVSEPGHARRHYRIGMKREGDGYLAPDSWVEQHDTHEGSWWPEWVAWLRSHSSPADIDAPSRQKHLFSESVADAPGEYVFQR